MSGTTHAKKRRERLDRLRRRADHLDIRIAESKGDLTYDRGEVSALRWAIEFIERHGEPTV